MAGAQRSTSCASNGDTNCGSRPLTSPDAQLSSANKRVEAGRSGYGNPQHQVRFVTSPAASRVNRVEGRLQGNTNTQLENFATQLSTILNQADFGRYLQ
jgi:hypothetical protein